MTDSPATTPYGAWTSSISAEACSAGRVALSDLRVADGELYWIESMPAAGGISGLFKLAAHAAAGTTAQRISPDGENVRTRVHEYGGAAHVEQGGRIYYSRYADQLLYELQPGGKPVPCTRPGYRYADCVPEPDGSGLICVREDHTRPGEPRNEIVRLRLSGNEPAETVLYSGSDFVAYPRPSADGRQLAFITWNHPNMPWDGTQLQVGELTQDGLRNVACVAGGPGESVLDPVWDRDGALYFISDHSGWWNLYCRDAAGIDAVWSRPAEFAAPLWSLGQSNYVVLQKGIVLARFTEAGIDRLVLLDRGHTTSRVLDLPFVEFDQLVAIDARHVVAIAGSSFEPPAIVRIEVETGRAVTVHTAGAALLPRAAVSVATPLAFPTSGDRTAHAFFYAPVNPHCQAPPGALPPLLVFVHGGPTSAASPAFATRTQFWTSRGFAVLDVDYGGSSGFGRDYRRQLNGNWGVVDVADVIAAARHVCGMGSADPSLTAISGGSAGGFTVLAALSCSDVFKAGADYYGVSDMTALASDTHKFESRYLDSLIGPLPAARDLYESRSPLNHLDGFTAPLIVLQGADDPVVPPSQSERIVAALRSRRVPVAYLLFAGESHGFRNPENQVRALQAELSFYGQVFGFTPADALPALQIENLSAQP